MQDAVPAISVVKEGRRKDITINKTLGWGRDDAARRLKIWESDSAFFSRYQGNAEPLFL
jgi:hypothetical protein